MSSLSRIGVSLLVAFLLTGCDDRPAIALVAVIFSFMFGPQMIAAWRGKR